MCGWGHVIIVQRAFFMVRLDGPKIINPTSVSLHTQDPITATAGPARFDPNPLALLVRAGALPCLPGALGILAACGGLPRFCLSLDFWSPPFFKQIR